MVHKIDRNDILGRCLYRAQVAAVTVALIGVPAIASAGASAAGHAVPASQVAAAGQVTPAATKSACTRWKVRGPKNGKQVEVFEDPSKIRHIKPKRVWKRPGQVVTARGCTVFLYFNKREKEWYVPVQAAKAADRVGWIRLNALRPATS